MPCINIEKSQGLEATVLIKLEYFNPAGSVKDRIAKSMLEDAEEKGILKRFGHHRADLRKYGNRTCSDCRGKGLSCDSHDA